MIYNRRTGLSEVQEFSDDERASAMQARYAAEDRVSDDPDVEVVVLAASDRQTLERTHARYFNTVSGLIEQMNSDVSGE
jgi:hypothetical protein